MKKVFLYAAAVLSVAYAAFLALRPARGPTLRDEMLQASTLMAAAEAAVRDCRVKAGVAIDPEADPNGTGLVGLETSPITTSLGNLGAKRTTTNPNFAGPVAALLAEAGVRSGDTIAVGASGSFPALIIALTSAVASSIPTRVTSSGKEARISLAFHRAASLAWWGRTANPSR